MRSLQQHYTLPSMSDPPSPPPSVDSDIAVILAALLCALICVVGLALVARCAWFHRSPPSSCPPPTKGIKKKVLNSLPKLSFRKDLDISADCPICLAEFVGGDEIRILPQCGHAFHVGCVDTWLGSRSSCPSCRRVLVAAKVGEMQREEENRCRIGCGAEEDERRDDGNHFLP